MEVDAVLGSVPPWVYAPQNIDEATDIIEATARDNSSVAFLGGGTEIDLGPPIRRLDSVVRTTGLSKVVEYVPADMIVTAEAGMTLFALSQTVAKKNQRLALDPPLADRATVGGVIAANSFGPRRARFGSVRDLLIGISFVRPDGVLVRGGGKVVKNVAGFDIPKLLCGSLGTLGLIATATFRLHPLPEAERTMHVASCNSIQLRELVARIKAAQLEPTSVVAITSGTGRFEVGLRFEGFGPGVTHQIDRFAGLQRSAGGCERLDPREAGQWWERHDDARTQGNLRVKIAALPSQIELLLPKVDAVLEKLRRPQFVWYASLGLGFITGTISESAATARSLEEARRLLNELGGSLVLHAAPEAIRQEIVEWGSQPAAFQIMSRIKQRFDPRCRFNPGRFVGGL